MHAAVTEVRRGPIRIDMTVVVTMGVSSRMPRRAGHANPIVLDAWCIAPVLQALTEKGGKLTRTVQPSKDTSADSTESKLAVEETNFRQLVGDQTDGTFARFLQDKLHVMLWHRAAADSNLLFGAQVNTTRLVEELQGYVTPGAGLEQEVCVALLDDAGRPVAYNNPV